MSEKRNRSLGVRILLAVVLLFILAAMLVPVYYYTAPNFVEGERLSVDDGWDIEAHGKVYKNVALSQTTFDMCNKSDVVTITRILPESPVISSPVFQVYSVHSAVDVYLEGELIYTYGHELLEKKQMLGYGLNDVLLPDNYPGKTIQVVYTVSENRAFDGLPQMYIYNGTTMLQKEISSKRLSIAISMFLGLFGIMGMCMALYMLLTNNSFASTFCIMAFSFIVGVWTLCNADMIKFFTPSLNVKANMEYIFFFLMILPLLGYFSERVSKPYCKRWLKNFYRTLCIADGIFVVAAFALHQLNLVHYPAMVLVNHIFMALTLLFIILEEIMAFRMNHKSQPILLIGFSLAVVGAIVELLRYNLGKYWIGFKGNQYDNTVGVVTFIVVAALFADFLSGVTKNVYAEAEQKLLQRLAYMDELTGLANRRKCEDRMHELDGKQEYVLISMDMNGLKTFNDTYGHECGDVALKAFADLLGISYPNSATVGRMGGDEFLVILPDADSSVAKRYVKDMLTKIQIYNENTTGPIRLSAAYGYANSKEGDCVHKVYALADERMYECKRSMKESKIRKT